MRGGKKWSPVKENNEPARHVLYCYEELSFLMLMTLPHNVHASEIM